MKYVLTKLKGGSIDKVSVIIPTYNRFKYLLNAIKSIKEQTYKNIEIIVINDCSTQKEYYDYNWKENSINIIHLPENSKKKFGYACGGYVRNQGCKKAIGKYIAFCDDDDIWLSHKLEMQITALQQSNCKMCTTEGIIGSGIYDHFKKYQKYNSEYYYDTLKNIYKNKGSHLLDNGFSDTWNYDFIKIHNCIVTSSVIIENDTLKKINYMKNIRNGEEDYDCWLRLLKHTDSIYIKEPCIYYDNGHGDVQQY